MGAHRVIGKKFIRDDGRPKVTGALKFMGDLELDNMAYGVIVRSEHHHARILGIDTAAALAASGVVDIITAADIPGFNGFGIAGDDQPVFAQDKVRYLGDAVALAVAETKEAAEAAAALVRVDYEPLPAILDAADALKPGAPDIHEKGNLLTHFEFQSGDVAAAFAVADFVVEHTYTTPYQEHAYMETEAGLARRNADGSVEIWCPAQYCFRDRNQLVRILNLPPEKVIEHSSPLGGAFGGKDDMALQPILAVAVLKLGRPVKITISREESFLFSTKRLPFRLCAKTACDKDGKLLAHQVYALSEAGPYTGISGAVFNYAMENICGTYFVPSIDITGDCVFTNNANTGAFRGFGNNQTNFMMETQMEQLAQLCGMDPVAFRRMNCTKNGERLSYGNAQSPCAGADLTLQMLEKSSLWRGREAFKARAAAPHLKRGVGLAGSQHGNGLGNALPDDSTAAVRLEESGRFTVLASTEEMGQGNITTLKQMAAEVLGVAFEQVDLTCGDTSQTPDSGSSTASRVTGMAGLATVRAAEQFLAQLAEALGVPPEHLCPSPEGARGKDGAMMIWQELYRKLSPAQRMAEATVSMRQTDVFLKSGLHYIHSHVSQVAGVEVNTLTGEVRLVETEIVPSAGTVINQLGYEGQAEGGVVMSMGYTLLENYRAPVDGAPGTRNLQTYLVPGVGDVPKITVTPVELWEPEGPFGAKGLGEPVTIPGAPAITNAIHDATGVWIYDLPASPEAVLAALEAKG